MHDEWIARLEQAIEQSSQVLDRISARRPCTWISLPQERLTDARTRIDSIKASAIQLRGHAGRRSLETSIRAGAGQIDPLRGFEKQAQFNALRIAVIDLHEICQDLSQCYWICLSGLTSAASHYEPNVFLNRFLKSKQVGKALREASSGLVENGTSHLEKIRHAFTHSFTQHASRVIPEGSEMPRREPTRFVFEPTAQIPKTRYYEEVFDPLCQLGERPGSSDSDFSRAQRTDLNAALFSAGRLGVEIASAFIANLNALAGSGEAAPTSSVPAPDRTP